MTLKSFLRYGDRILKRVFCFVLALILSICVFPINPLVAEASKANTENLNEESYVIESEHLPAEISPSISEISFYAADTVGSNISLRLLADDNLAVPSIDLGSSGTPANIYIEETASTEFFNTPGLLGLPIDISGGGNFTSATLTFTLKVQALTAVICKYADGKTTVLNTLRDKSVNTISAEITSVGTYFVLDGQKMLDSYPMKPIDIVAVVDTTGKTDEQSNNIIETVNTLKDLFKKSRIDANVNLINYFESIEVESLTAPGEPIHIETIYPDTVNIDFNEIINKEYFEIKQDTPLFYIVVSDNEVNATYDNSITMINSSYDNITNSANTIVEQISKILSGDEVVIYLHGPLPIPVILNEEIKENSTCDTDGDGIYDVDELESLTPTGKFSLIALADILGLDTTDDKYDFLPIYKYKSNPAHIDSDFDGINDNKDTKPKSNSNSGILHCTVEGKTYNCNVEFNVDYRDILDGVNYAYSKDIAVLSSLIASDIYTDVYLEITDGAVIGGNDTATTLGSLIGLKDVKNIKISSNSYSVDKDDVTDFVIGHRNVIHNGVSQEIIVLSVRGTNATNAEWSSNFDVGADTSEYYSITGNSHPHWLNKDNHKGFDVTANRVLEKVLTYINTYVDSEAKKNILITGHSRGAAIANILGTYFEDSNEYNSYTYTFATPNTTTSKNASSYKTIFNLKNSDDLVPYLPMEKWGFVNYGITYTISIKDNYESGALAADVGTFEWLVGGEDYNNDGGTQRTLDCFTAIVNNRDQLYVIDNTSDGTAYENSIGHLTEQGAINELNELTATFESEKLMKFCRFTIVKGALIYKVKINYAPAYLMQSLANMTTGLGPLLGHAISGKYATAKNSFIASSGKVLVGGLAHPHMQPTYYLIAHNNFLPLK